MSSARRTPRPHPLHDPLTLGASSFALVLLSFWLVWKIGGVPAGALDSAWFAAGALLGASMAPPVVGVIGILGPEARPAAFRWAWTAAGGAGLLFLIGGLKEENLAIALALTGTVGLMAWACSRLLYRGVSPNKTET